MLNQARSRTEAAKLGYYNGSRRALRKTLSGANGSLWDRPLAWQSIVGRCKLSGVERVKQGTWRVCVDDVDRMFVCLWVVYR